MKEKLFLVQFSLPGGQTQDTEFGGTRVAIDGNSLLIYGLPVDREPSDPAETLQMAFGPGIWRAVCEIDPESGFPLLPASPRPSAEADTPQEELLPAAPVAAAQPAPSAPVAETPAPRAATTPELAAPPRQSGESPFSPKSQSSGDAKRARIEELASELDKAPYAGLEAFGLLTGANRSEAEWALCAALISGRLAPESLQEVDQQNRLDQFGPELLGKAGVAKLGPLIKALPQVPSLVGVDAVQVQIWLLRRNRAQA